MADSFSGFLDPRLDPAEAGIVRFNEGGVAPPAPFAPAPVTVQPENETQYGSSGLMSRILGGNRESTIAARQNLFGGTFSGGGGGIADDRIMLVNPDTGVAMTWAQVKAEWTGKDLPGGVRFDPSITLNEWVSGGWSDYVAGFLGGEVSDTGTIVPPGLTTGSGSGRGSGAVEPTFIPQDPATVREQVKAYVVATTGTANEDLINQGVKTFQTKNKEAFDKRESQTIDAWAAVQSGVRASAKYKAIHQLRPDSVDELSYVTSRQAKLRQLGVSDARAEGLGISAATAGATDEALTSQAQTAQVGGTGRLLRSQRESLKQSANAVLGLV